MKIRLNREFFKRRIKDFLEDGDVVQARLYNLILQSYEHKSDIEISDEET